MAGPLDVKTGACHSNAERPVKSYRTRLARTGQCSDFYSLLTFFENALNIELPMKSSYELAMERSTNPRPGVKLTNAQKTPLPNWRPKLQGTGSPTGEILVKGEIEKAWTTGEYKAWQYWRSQMVSDRKPFRPSLKKRRSRFERHQVSRFEGDPISSPTFLLEDPAVWLLR